MQVALSLADCCVAGQTGGGGTAPGLGGLGGATGPDGQQLPDGNALTSFFQSLLNKERQPTRSGSVASGGHIPSLATAPPQAQPFHRLTLILFVQRLHWQLWQRSPQPLPQGGAMQTPTLRRGGRHKSN